MHESKRQGQGRSELSKCSTGEGILAARSRKLRCAVALPNRCVGIDRIAKRFHRLAKHLPCPSGLRRINLHVRLETFSIVWALMVMAVFVSVGENPSKEESGIEGVITISPTQPGPIRPNVPASLPLVNAAFIVENERGQVTSFTTDQQGHFRTLLAPGHYKVSLKAGKSTIGHFGPFEVDVLPGKVTNVHWECDSGIR